MILSEEEVLQKKIKKKKKMFKKKYAKTSAAGMFKDKKSGFIINRNKNELLLVKAAMNNAKVNNENREKVQKLEQELEELKNILIKVAERN